MRISDWSSDVCSSDLGFLARTIERNPQISGLLESGSVEEAYALAQAAGEGAAGTGQALRWRRNAIALVTAIADLSGAWDLNRVPRTLSDFADTALDEAIATAFVERVPDAEPRGFAVIALGKHGSRGLRYSWARAPRVLFGPETQHRRDGKGPSRNR